VDHMVRHSACNVIVSVIEGPQAVIYRNGALQECTDKAIETSCEAGSPGRRRRKVETVEAVVVV